MLWHLCCGPHPRPHTGSPGLPSTDSHRSACIVEMTTRSFTKTIKCYTASTGGAMALEATATFCCHCLPTTTGSPLPQPGLLSLKNQIDWHFFYEPYSVLTLSLVPVQVGPVQAGLGLWLREKYLASLDYHRMWILCAHSASHVYTA